MKPFRHLITAAAAAACMLSGSVICYAEPDDGNNYVVTTTTGTSAEGNGVVWTQLTQESNTNGLDNNAVNLGISVSVVEDNKFTATVEINSKEKFSYVAGSVGYEKENLKLVSAKILEAAGGALVEDNAEGKYGFQYSNPQGSSYSGGYIQLSFEVIGKEKKDDVLFLSVDSVLDIQSQAMNFNKSDGVVKPSASPNVSADAITVRLATNAKPYTLEELGWKDALNCELDSSSVAKFSDNGIVAMTPGKVSGKLIYKDYSIKKIVVEVYRVDENGVEHDDPASAQKTEDKEKPVVSAKKSVNIGVPILLVIAGGFAWLLANQRIKQQKKRMQRPAPGSGRYDPRAYSQMRRPPRRNPYPRQRTGHPPVRNVPRDRNTPPYDM